MKIRIVIIFIVTLLVLACNNKNKPKAPNNLISKAKMEQILYDLYIINAAKGVNRKLLEKNGFEPETYVLTKYNIDSTQFADSNAYYAFDTEEYKSIIEKVKAKLEKDKKTFEKLEKKEGMAAKRRRDSIKNSDSKKKDSIKEIIKKNTAKTN